MAYYTFLFPERTATYTVGGKSFAGWYERYSGPFDTLAEAQAWGRVYREANPGKPVVIHSLET